VTSSWSFIRQLYLLFEVDSVAC